MITWHHSPTHQLKATCAYIITGATLEKQHHFSDSTSLDLMQKTLFSLTEKYQIKLKA